MTDPEELQQHLDELKDLIAEARRQGDRKREMSLISEESRVRGALNDLHFRRYIESRDSRVIGEETHNSEMMPEEMDDASDPSWGGDPR